MAVIIPEAGGRFSTVGGNDGPDAYQQGSGVATNGAIHDAVLDLFDD